MCGVYGLLTVLYGGYGYFTICLRLFYGYFTVILRLFYGYFTVGYGYFTAGLRLFYDLSTVILRLEYGEMASWEVPETEKPAQFKTNNPTPPGFSPFRPLWCASSTRGHVFRRQLGCQRRSGSGGEP